ncbi:PREDICTED: jerky protein homolog-like [Dufourea novaeangliae]|uniref:jerky protein homolog-like n=1 Tax=Dufourea novaeangliae TaxID=178035 RepID=UPI0007678F0C|nr:PREDICTED: jerky protein homolog-like [Dufourea novaeangliae]
MADIASKKKAKVVLSMQQRLEILEDLKTQSHARIAEKYGVHPRTIYRISRNAARISEFTDRSKEQKERRAIKRPKYEELEQCMLTWIAERRSLGDILSDAVIFQKAAEMKKNFPLYSHSNLTRTWLASFKKRNNIRFVNGFRDTDSADVNAAGVFVKDLKNLIEEEHINVENIYNMDESRLMWKALPKKVQEKFKEECLGRSTISSERITLVLCANASGTNKMTPLLIYKYQNPRSLKDCKDSLPVIFKSQANGCMDQSLFKDWFENHFKPDVRKYQVQKEINGKVILLLDNCDEHELSTDIEEDDDFKIIYLPPYTTTLIHPMYQGIVLKTKRLFLHRMLQRVVRCDGGVNEFYKDYNMKSCIDILHESWAEVTSETIRNAWNEIIPVPAANFEETEERDQSLQRDLQDLISTIIGEKSTEQHVTEFLSACEEVGRKSFPKKEKLEDECEENENKNDNKDEEDDVEKDNIDDSKDEDSFKERKEIVVPRVIDEGNFGEQEELLVLGDTDEDNFEEQEEILVPRDLDEDTIHELKYLLGHLMFYSTKAPPYIQLIVQSSDE